MISKIELINKEKIRHRKRRRETMEKNMMKERGELKAGEERN